MATLVMTLQFLAGLCLIVAIHEFGHLIAARIFGIKVKKFYLFFDAFGFAIYRKTIRGTEYGIGWLPLGGYIRMSGIFSETDDDDTSPSGKRFDKKPAWQRIIVMLSGIIMNTLFAIVVFTALFFYYGRNQLVGLNGPLKIVPGVLGKQVGLRPGDEVAAMNADSVFYEDEMLSTHLMHGHTILSVVRKQGKERVHMHIAVSPKLMQLVANRGLTQFFSIQAGFKIDSVYTNIDPRNDKDFSKANIVALNGDSIRSYNEFVIKLKENKKRQLYLTVIHEGKTSTMLAHTDKDGHIGFSLDSKIPPAQPVRMSLGGSVASGAVRVVNAVSENGKGLSEIVTGQVKATESLAGPIRFATFFGEHFDSRRFWNLLAILSVGVAFFNLLPIPLLDGGTVLLLAVEAIRGKPVKQNHIEVFQASGFVFMIIVAAFVFYNDIQYLTQ
ncbi:RIP metalloprotease RseP [Mucilaginibacter pedocola]|uniref:Zinc metalloprotease n=1 Tax=Mucilaginibacter pedocola TaxID=1792845 RepID=A0A1S9P8S2_9SPHI|nr:RIP metalloprotease RseP [Mucilaginibacter pedocola]OOQ57345.1 RIP metalloprotease RseP [Mucilaginibacter pedocola]